MRASKKINIICLMVVLPFLLLSFTSPVLAGEGYGTQVGEKLGRGLANTVTGWVEIPKNVVNTSKDSNVGIGLSWGLVRGIVQSIGRTLVGVGEFATFFVPTPEIIHPTYIFEDFHRDTRYGLTPAPHRPAPVPREPR
jgi:putative exosortase-associated protein (TIGR04073 family)